MGRRAVTPPRKVLDDLRELVRWALRRYGLTRDDLTVQDDKTTTIKRGPKREGLRDLIRIFFAPTTTSFAPERCIRILDAVTGCKRRLAQVTDGSTDEWLVRSSESYKLLRDLEIKALPEMKAVSDFIGSLKLSLGLQAAAASLIDQVEPQSAAALASVLVKLLVEAKCVAPKNQRSAQDTLSAYLGAAERTRLRPAPADSDVRPEHYANAADEAVALAAIAKFLEQGRGTAADERRRRTK